MYLIYEESGDWIESLLDQNLIINLLLKILIIFKIIYRIPYYQFVKVNVQLEIKASKTVPIKVIPRIQLKTGKVSYLYKIETLNILNKIEHCQKCYT